MRLCTGLTGISALALCSVVLAQNPSTQPTTLPNMTNPVPGTQPLAPGLSASEAPHALGHLGKIVVTSFEEQMQQVAPALGATTYTLNPEQVQTIPGGENTPFQQVLLRTPGVVQDSFGQEHVRGEHANLTYRVNGVLLPQPIATFGQELDTRLIQSTTLITGSLPAQFGLHTAGIVDVTTKTGQNLQGGEISLYGGMNDWIQPSVMVGGVDGKLDYFVTASWVHNDLGIENPTGSHRALHDYTDQEKAFTYLSYRFDETSRLSFFSNLSYSNFQIPNTPGLPTSFDLAGHPSFDSAHLNERQNEQEYYMVLAFQKTVGDLSYQISGFTRYGQIRFTPDSNGDLLFQGVAGNVYNNFITSGVQFDSSYVLNDRHTIRAGFITDYTREHLNTQTSVFALNPDGTQASNVPFSISDDSGNTAWESGIYIQDEWRLTSKLTLNYGLRYDRFDASFDTEDQLSSRANLVYNMDDRTTLHAGYSRYFVPPPVQNVTRANILRFAGTSNAPENFTADPPKVEKSNYYDLGIAHQFSKEFSLNLDGFYKDAHNLVDLGQFGAPVILSPFNYREATVYGAELSGQYLAGGFSAYGNFGWVKTFAHDIDSQQYLIANDELAFIRLHDIHLDHEAEFTASAGASYTWKNDMVYVDFLYGSGLRGGFANTHQLAQHYPVNVGYEHVFHLGGDNGRQAIKFRVDVVNLFDERYELRDGSGIGVGASQFGARRAIYAGLTYTF